jgi:hypothetical protein
MNGMPLPPKPIESMPVPPKPENTLDLYLESERHAIRVTMDITLRTAKGMINRDPELYIDSDHVTPSIDVRLLVFEEPGGFSWVLTTGCVDYDLEHSTHCSAGLMTTDSISHELADELIEGI